MKTLKPVNQVMQFLVFLGLLIASSLQGYALTIVRTDDASMSNTSIISAADKLAADAAFDYAAAQYEALFNDPIHINIVLAVAGTSTLGQSLTQLSGYYTYAQIKTALISDASTDAYDQTTIANLPSSDPIGGTAARYLVSKAQAKALGLISDDLTTDGTFTFGAGHSYTYDPLNRASTTGQYDFIGVALHEISEIMGRISLLGTNEGNGISDYLLYDLFRFTSNTVRSMNKTDVGVYFSINDGQNNLKSYNPPGGGDLQDWDSGTNDSYNAFTSDDVMDPLSTVDIEVMDVIGYNLAITTADLWVMDNPVDEVTQYQDIGVEPDDRYKDNLNDGGYIWVSGDIWVSPSSSKWAPGDENITYDGTTNNYIYVTVRNRGSIASSGADNQLLNVHWTKASLNGGVGSWPDFWNGNEKLYQYGGCSGANTSIPLGGLISPATVNYQKSDGSSGTAAVASGNITIPVIDPSETVTFQIPWLGEDPEDYSCISNVTSDEEHFCLLARIQTGATHTDAIATPYGMDYAEGSDVGSNTYLNKKIAWHNITIIDNDGNGLRMAAITGNIESIHKTYNLLFKVPAAELGNPITSNGQIGIDLGQALYQKWVDGGAQSTGILLGNGATGGPFHINDTLPYSIIIDSPSASLNYLPFAANELHAFTFQINYSVLNNTGANNIYNFDVIQQDSATDSIVGGERYRIIEPLCPTPSAGNITIISGNSGVFTGMPTVDNAVYNWYSTATGALLHSGQTYTVSPTVNTVYKLEMVSPSGCIDTTKDTVTMCVSTLTFHLKCFLEGYYQSVGTSTPMDFFGNGGCLYLSGISSDPTEADTITISLMDPNTQSQVGSSIKAILHTDGSVWQNGSSGISFPCSMAGNSYYIRITHRNAIETWSANPVLIGSMNYDFSTTVNQACCDGATDMVWVDNIGGQDVYAFWSGDVYDEGTNLNYAQDGVIDGGDYSLEGHDYQRFLFGYYTTDVTGDGAVDGSDYGLVQTNFQQFIFKQTPW